MTNSLAHNWMPEWAQNLILHSQTSHQAQWVWRHSSAKKKKKSCLKKERAETRWVLLSNKGLGLQLKTNLMRCFFRWGKLSTSKRKGLDLWEVKTEQSNRTWHERKTEGCTTEIIMSRSDSWVSQGSEGEIPLCDYHRSFFLFFLKRLLKCQTFFACNYGFAVLERF